MRLGKTLKRKTPDKRIVLERRMIGLDQVIALDPNKCTGCRDCQAICPREAISSCEPVIENGSLKEPVRMDIDQNLCNFCGQCAVICPTKAISWRENQADIPTIISSGIFPVLKEGIDVQTEKCHPDCQLVCEESCPVDALKVEVHPDADTGKDIIAAVKVDTLQCFYCHKCEKACPYDAISVQCARDGIVIFLPANCLEGCYACTEVCPSEALYLENGQVQLDESVCIFCRACETICPVDDALEIKREKIKHEPVYSHLWVEIQEKLISKTAKWRLMQAGAFSKRNRAFRTRID